MECSFSLYDVGGSIGDVKRIVSQDWEGLLLVLLGRYNILDIAAKYLLLILKSSSYLKMNIFMPLRRGEIRYWYR
jgi:hypothetical protein